MHVSSQEEPITLQQRCKNPNKEHTEKEDDHHIIYDCINNNISNRKEKLSLYKQQKPSSSITKPHISNSTDNNDT